MQNVESRPSPNPWKLGLSAFKEIYQQGLLIALLGLSLPLLVSEIYIAFSGAKASELLTEAFASPAFQATPNIYSAFQSLAGFMFQYFGTVFLSFVLFVTAYFTLIELAIRVLRTPQYARLGPAFRVAIRLAFTRGIWATAILLLIYSFLRGMPFVELIVVMTLALAPVLIVTQRQSILGAIVNALKLSVVPGRNIFWQTSFLAVTGLSLGLALLYGKQELLQEWNLRLLGTQSAYYMEPFPFGWPYLLTATITNLLIGIGAMFFAVFSTCIYLVKTAEPPRPSFEKTG